MLAEVYWIKGLPWHLAILPRPRGGEWLGDEITLGLKAET